MKMFIMVFKTEWAPFSGVHLWSIKKMPFWTVVFINLSSLLIWLRRIHSWSFMKSFQKAKELKSRYETPRENYS